MSAPRSGDPFYRETSDASGRTKLGDILEATRKRRLMEAAAPQLYCALYNVLAALDANTVARLGIEQEVLAASCAIAKAEDG